MKQLATIQPNFLNLKTLAAYSSCSVRWLRNRLVDRVNPLPHYRIEGKLLVKRDEFDDWMAAHRVGSSATALDQIVEDVMTTITQPRRVA